MKYGCKHFFALLLVCVCFPVQATSISQLSMDEILARADLIFQGRVLAIEGRKAAKGRLYYTHVTFAVEDVIKGQQDKETLTLRFMGGAVSGRGLKVAGVVYPQLDERGIYFVAANHDKRANPLLGWSQGHFIVRQDEQGAARIYTNSRKAVVSMNVRSAAQVARKINPTSALGVVVESQAAKADSVAKPAVMGLVEFKRQLREAVFQGASK